MKFRLQQIILLLLIPALTHCDKSNESDFYYATDAAFAQEILNAIFTIVVQQNTAKSSEFDIFNCFNVNSEQLSKNNYKTCIDFSENGCPDINSNLLKGKIYLESSGNWYLTGSTTLITFVNFSRNNQKINGIINIKYNARITDTTGIHPQFIMEVQNLNILFEDSTSIQFSGTQKITWRKGFYSSDLFDKTIEISSIITGTNRRKNIFTYNSEKLVFPFTCLYTTEGIVNVTKENNKQIVFDYGKKLCDRKIILYQKGAAIEFDAY